MYQKYKTDQYSYQCSVRKSILHCLQMLSDFKPIQVVDEKISREDFYHGQKEFHEFIENLYCLMLGDPDKFLIPTNEYDAYIQSDKAKAAGSGICGNIFQPIYKLLMAGILILDILTLMVIIIHA